MRRPNDPIDRLEPFDEMRSSLALSYYKTIMTPMGNGRATIQEKLNRDFFGWPSASWTNKKTAEYIKSKMVYISKIETHKSETKMEKARSVAKEVILHMGHMDTPAARLHRDAVQQMIRNPAMTLTYMTSHGFTRTTDDVTLKIARFSQYVNEAALIDNVVEHAKRVAAQIETNLFYNYLWPTRYALYINGRTPLRLDHDQGSAMARLQARVDEN